MGHSKQYRCTAFELKHPAVNTQRMHVYRLGAMAWLWAWPPSPTSRAWSCGTSTCTTRPWVGAAGTGAEGCSLCARCCTFHSLFGLGREGRQTAPAKTCLPPGP